MWGFVIRMVMEHLRISHWLSNILKKLWIKGTLSLYSNWVMHMIKTVSLQLILKRQQIIMRRHMLPATPMELSALA